MSRSLFSVKFFKKTSIIGITFRRPAYQDLNVDDKIDALIQASYLIERELDNQKSLRLEAIESTWRNK